MKTLTFVSTGRYHRNPTIIDFDKHIVEPLDRLRIGIDDIYVAPEPLEVRYKKDGRDIVLKADKGDIIIVFYTEEWVVNPIVVVKNKDWKTNIVEYIKKQEADKAKELVNASYCSCDGCDCKCCCESC